MGDLDLLARVVAHERWRLERPNIGWPPRCAARRSSEGILWRWHPDPGRWLPDPDDHATAGVLYALLRRDDPDALWSVEARHPDGRVWVLDTPDFGVVQRSHAGTSLGWACVRALAALWGVA